MLHGDTRLTVNRQASPHKFLGGTKIKLIAIKFHFSLEMNFDLYATDTHHILTAEENLPRK